MPRGIPKTGKRVSRANERRAIRPAVIDPHQLYDVPEAAAARGRSVAALYNDIKLKRIKVTRVDGRTLILGREIIQANLAAAGLSSAEAPEAAGAQ